MKNKIIALIISICLCFSLMSCEQTTNPGGDNNDPFNGIDISKYEMPQTGFLNDGHELSKTEELMKYVIENGEFVYDSYSDGIGYKLILSENDDVVRYAFYSIDFLRINEVQASYRTFNVSYVKLSNNESIDDFTLMHKIVYNSWRDDFYAIMKANKSTFNKEYSGEYELFRGYSNYTKEEVSTLVVSAIDRLFTEFNTVVGSKANITLKDIGYTNY